MAELKRITITWEDYDDIADKWLLLREEGVLLTDDLALTFMDDCALLEEIKVSEKYPGEYEPVKVQAEFDFSIFKFLRNYDQIPPNELLEKVFMATLFHAKREEE
jgi:hypothetical protein